MKHRYLLLPLIVPVLLATHWLWLKLSPYVRSCLKPVNIEENNFSYGWAQDSNWELFGTLTGDIEELGKLGWQDKTRQYPYELSEWKWLYEQEFRPRYPRSHPREMTYLYFTDDPDFPEIRMHALVHNPSRKVYILGSKQ